MAGVAAARRTSQGVVATALFGLVAAGILTHPAAEGDLLGPPQAVLVAIPVVRLATLAALTVSVGIALVSCLLGEDVLDDLRRVGAGAWIGGALALSWLEASAVTPSSWGASLSQWATYLWQINTGRVLAVSVALGVFAALDTRRAERLVVALVASVALPLSGHASQMDRPGLAMTAVCIHCIAVVGWVGGVAALAALAIASPRHAERALPRFAPVAATSIAATAASGVVLAIGRLGSPGVDSPVGAVVLLKVVGLVALGGLGAVMRFRVIPQVAAGRTAAALWPWIGIELAVMALVLGLATGLARPV